MAVLRSQRTEPLSLTADPINASIASAFSWASEDGSTATSNGKDSSGNSRHMTPNGSAAQIVTVAGVGKGRDTSNGRTVHNVFYTAASSAALGMDVGTGAFSFYLRLRTPSVVATTTAVRSLFRFNDGTGGTPLVVTMYEVAGTGYCWYPYMADGTTKLNWNDVNNPAYAANVMTDLFVTRSATGGTVKFYVNGTLIKTVTGNTTAFASTVNQAAIAGLFDNNGGSEADFVLFDTINWTRELSATEVASYSGNPYGYWTNSAVADSINVTSPVVSSTTGTSMTIAGTYAGGDNPDYIEASFNGGAFANIGGTLTGGNFSGTLTGLTPGTGSVVVRWHNFPAVTQTITNVTVSSASLSFNTPDATLCAMNYRGFQRNSSNQASVRIVGAYTGTPTNLEYQYCGGTWATLVTGPTGGVFDATVLLQGPNHGNLIVRFSNNTAVTATLNDVGVGDVAMVLGQSNHVGKGTNYIAQVSPAANPGWRSLELDKSNTWIVEQENATTPFSKEYASPYSVYNTSGGPGGSYFGELARMYMAAGVPIYFVPCAVGSTSISAWSQTLTSTANLYGAAIDRANKLGTTGHKMVLWWQGEDDALNTTTQAAYTSALNAIINDWVSRYPGTKWVLMNINNTRDGSLTYSNFTPISTAIAAVAATNTNVAAIADMNGAWTSGNTHYGQASAAEITAVATRAFTAVQSAFLTVITPPVKYKFKRGTRAQLNTAASNSLLNQGEPYLITDENRFALGSGVSTYEAYIKQSDPGVTGATLYSASVDFGQTGARSKVVSVTNTAAYTTSKFVASAQPDSDEYEMDPLSVAAYCTANGTVNIIVNALAGPVNGIKKVTYQIG